MKYLRAPIMTANNAKLTILFAILLYCVWFSFSGQFSILFLLLGSTSVFLVTLLINLALKIPFQIFLLPPIKAIKYMFWLILQIIFSSFYVIKKVFIFDTNKLKSKIITIENKHTNDLLTVIFTNSVTLTPGTATVFINDNKISIHILHNELEAGIYEMHDKIADLFRKNAEN